VTSNENFLSGLLSPALRTRSRPGRAPRISRRNRAIGKHRTALAMMRRNLIRRLLYRRLLDLTRVLAES